MTIGLDVQDGGVLYGILADLGGDIVIKADRFGFIEDASQGLHRAGFDLSEQLIAPHIADLTDALHAGLVLIGLAKHILDGFEVCLGGLNLT